MQRLTIRAGAVVVLGLSALLAVARAEIIEQVLVKVNGEIFTKTDLEARQVSTLRALGQADAASKPGDAQLRKMLDDITPQLMVNIVDEMLLIHRGKELGYTLSEEQFKSIVDNIKKENQLDTEEAFQAALKQEGMTMADLRRQLERQALMSNVTRNEVQNKIAVSEEETRQLYESRIKDFTTSPTVTLREILIAAPAGSPAEAEARSKAEAARQRALAGESFEKIAAELSESPSRANGGLIGPFALDDLAADVRQTVEPLKAGEITPVVRTSGGFQLLRLESSTPREVKPFEQVRQQVTERVYEVKQQTELQNLLEKLRQQSIIEWKSPELKKAYDAGLERIKSGTAPPLS